jgi:hypothetical protein
MDKLLEETQNYFTTVVNKNKEAATQYNNALRQQWMLERNYTDGTFLVDKSNPAIMFGKPNNTEARVNVIIDELLSDIKSGDEGFIKFIDAPNQNFTNKVIRQLKENYKAVVTNKKGTYSNGITTITQSMTNVQQVYVGYIARANTLMYYPSSYPGPSGTDGKQDKLGNVISYTIIPTTEVDPSSQNVTNTLDEMGNDILSILTGITEFNLITNGTLPFIYTDGKEYSGTLVFRPEYKLNDQKIFEPFNLDNFPTDDLSLRRVYMILSDDVTDSKKYETFKNAMIGNILSNPGIIGNGDEGVENADNLSKQFDKYWDVQTKKKFVNENDITKEFITHMEKNELQDFLKFTPYSLKKKRMFTYTTENANTEGQIALIKGLGASENQNTNNKTWNDEISAEVFISKAKFN